MVRELRDELEVSGHVVAIKLMTIAEIHGELNDIMDDWESRGFKTPNDVPESPTKHRYRDLLRASGVKINF